MAFLSKVGNMLRQRASKQIRSEFCALKPSVYQAIRCLSSMSSSKLLIGGLSNATDEQSLKETFAKYGEVVEARFIMDREIGRSRGFGFVTYTYSEETSSAIQALDGQDLHGCRVRVNYATDRARPSFGGGNYGGDYGSNAYGGGGGGGDYGNSAYGGGGGYDAGGSGYGSGGYGSGGNYQGGGGGKYGSDGYAGGAAGSGFGGSGGYSGDGNYAGGNTYEGVNSGGYGSTAGNYGDGGI
ncbi:LOW QUALITY PROTEIN: glycine-rich RNA-binding protein 3, mitochondrial-like [Juglans microcarpa x Juglans regia]|uniref:LOW QUALITY PROTEIN: glycine-rich RNA-binding protein 3, mitochondrial-like n=1 Tax=Juglans microcarpa x Juglans regia TaxID=2249226 RepID=UPI001B7DBE1D|nr:LOW QUALITY PROTEIN: glycine-rich RNA-binding protein 3, mitochondrial-like [Juglans microcarpa x Juglans regia]